MEIIRRSHSMAELSRRARARGLKVGLVPTMGSLHEGHVSLIRQTHEVVDVVVVSIFVNPTQFNEKDDFDRYPRDLTGDADVCIAEAVDYLFAPTVEEMYPKGPQTFVEVSGLSDRLEGESRPGHFRGVTTVVLKLLEIVRPHVAAFGQKDAQQAVIVRRMIEDLMLGVELLVLPTVRDANGLALSSRNRRLDDDQLHAARAIPRALEIAEERFQSGQNAAEDIVGAARSVLDDQEGVEIDYVELVDPKTLEPVGDARSGGLLLAAVHCGPIRLLDNTILKRDPEGSR